MKDKNYRFFREQANRLREVYTHFNTVALAVKVGQEWLLLHASVVLTPGVEWNLPGAAYPEEYFLAKQEMRVISELDGFIEDMKDSKLRFSDLEMRIPALEKRSLHWTYFNPYADSWQMSGYPGIGVRAGSTGIYSFLSSLDFDHRLVLQNHFRHPYDSLSEFTDAVINTPLDETRIITVDYFAPSWCKIDWAQISAGRIVVRIVCPAKVVGSLRFQVESVQKDADGRPQLILQGTCAVRPDSEPEPVDSQGQLVRLTMSTTEDRLENQRFVIPVLIRDQTPRVPSSTVILFHESGVMMDRFVLAGGSQDANVNDVGYSHFERAVELAGMCLPEDDRPHPKVGCVVVRNGKIVVDAFRGEIGRGDHAEYIALERKGRGNAAIEDADLITTLEPCTTRSHDKRPCTSWIKSRRIRKVWIGSLDYNPQITGVGELQLQEAGILIGRFPDSFQKRTIEQNRAFFEHIKSKQPSISAEDVQQKHSMLCGLIAERFDELRARLRTQQVVFDEVGWDTLGKLGNAHERALTLDPKDSRDWVLLGIMLLEAKQWDPALLAYKTCSEIDATIPQVWESLAHCEVALFRQWGMSLQSGSHQLTKAEKYLEKAEKNGGSSERMGPLWQEIGDEWTKGGAFEDAARCYKKAQSMQHQAGEPG